jgi:predicted nucleic acid-binding protein
MAPTVESEVGPGGPVFVDSSALYALFDADDGEHERVARLWERLVAENHSLFVTNYVLLETSALLQRRLGVESVRALEVFVVPWLNVTWIDEALHAQAVAALLAANRRDLSLVDCASFSAMRRAGVFVAFALDRHFGEQGFSEFA